MPLKPGDPGYNYDTGNTQQTNTVQVNPSPSGGGQGSTVGTPQQQQAAPLAPAQSYQMGGNFYYHPSLGVGTMTGVWGDIRGGGSRRHEGQDIRMPMNTPLVAVTSGTIQHYKNSSAGTVIYLKGDDGNKYSYFHLNSRIAKNGQRVQAGQRIAYSGNTGNSSAPHLHFETWINGKKQDPRPFLSHTRSPGNGQGGGLKPGDPGYDYQGGDTPSSVPAENDLFDQANSYYEDAADIYGGFGNIDMSNPNQPYGQWADQLRSIQQAMANQGLAENPRKIKAHNLLRQTMQGMSDMVKRDGYQSSFPGTGDGQNVVKVEE